LSPRVGQLSYLQALAIMDLAGSSHVLRGRATAISLINRLLTALMLSSPPPSCAVISGQSSLINRRMLITSFVWLDRSTYRAGI